MVIVPVGAAFDFISGERPQSPKWIQKLGFEWLFRLINEPARLSKRYIFYGTIYLCLIIKEKIRLITNDRYY